MKTKNDADKLLTAAAKYIEKKGGRAVVIGDIGIMKREGEYRYSLVINFTGKSPPTPAKE